MSAQSQQADILVLMTDQHRADWIGAYGAPWVRTPTLDTLASEGVTFTNCFTTCPICMPARASFLTGMHPHNFGMWDNVGRVQDTGDTCLHPLREVGYRTCHVGKSHLHPHGSGRDLRDAEPYMHALGWDDVLECTGPLSTQTTFSILTDWMKSEGIYQLFLDDYRRRKEHKGPALWPSPLPDGKHADDFMANTAVWTTSRARTAPSRCSCSWGLVARTTLLTLRSASTRMTRRPCPHPFPPTRRRNGSRGPQWSITSG